MNWRLSNWLWSAFALLPTSIFAAMNYAITDWEWWAVVWSACWVGCVEELRK